MNNIKGSKITSEELKLVPDQNAVCIVEEEKAQLMGVTCSSFKRGREEVEGYKQNVKKMSFMQNIQENKRIEDQLIKVRTIRY